MSFSPESRYDESTIQQALEAADLNVLRIALLQHTRDEELAAIPIELTTIPGTPYQNYVVPDEFRELILDKATEYLKNPDAPVNMSLSEDEVRSLAGQFEGVEVDDSVAAFVFEEIASLNASREIGWKLRKSRSRGTGTKPCSRTIFGMSGMFMPVIIISDPLGKFLAWKYRSMADLTQYVVRTRSLAGSLFQSLSIFP